MKVMFGFLIALTCIPLMAADKSEAEDQAYWANTTLYATRVASPSLALQLGDPLSGVNQLTLDSIWMLGVRVEIPFHRYFASGFGIRFSSANFNSTPIVPLLMEASTFLKIQLPFDLPFGFLNLYAMPMAGLNMSIGGYAPEPNGVGSLYHPIGGGYNFGGVLGVEYFPWRYIGAFVEGGYQVWYLSHEGNPDYDRQTGASIPRPPVQYFMRAPVLNFGIKVTL